MATIYSTGYGMRGYLPDSAPYVTLDHDDAIQYALGSLDALADYYRQVPDAGGEAELATCVTAIRSLEKLEADNEWSFVIGDFHYWIEALSPTELGLDESLSDAELEVMLKEVNDEGY